VLNEYLKVSIMEHTHSGKRRAQPALAKCLTAAAMIMVLTACGVTDRVGKRVDDTWAGDMLFDDNEKVILTSDGGNQLNPDESGKPLSVVVNGVDCAHFAGARPDPATQRVLFLGNYEYAPNVDAIEWALEEILPKVWEHCPEARMSVCGFGMPGSWRERWPDPRIEWQGFVPDLLQLQSRCSVFLAPLRHGGGSKLKVLEALAAGLPLASTEQGVSGLDLVEGLDYLGGQSAGGLANAVVRLLQHPEAAVPMGEAGRAYVRRAHDWNVAASQLEQVYAALAPHPHEEPACV